MSRPAFSICLCPDSHLLQGRINALCAARQSAAGAWQRHVFWGDDGLGQSFWEHLTLQGLFAAPKVLVVRNAQVLPAETLSKQLSPALLPLVPKTGRGELPSALIWPFICFEVDFEKGRPKVPAHIQKLAFWQKAEELGWMEPVPSLAGSALKTFIRAEASRHNLALTPAEITLLEDALPQDAAFISSELAKLALTADAEGRLAKNAATLISQAQELGIFELMRLVQQNSNAPAAWRRILEDRLSGENLVFAFVALVLREARVLWQCLAGTPPPLPPQIAMQKKIAAQTLGFAGLARLWQIALMADKGIKSGERSPDQAFEMLASDLFLLFSGKRAG